jgi:DNA repair ATPase RecN
LHTHNYGWAGLDRQERKVKNGVSPHFSSTQFVVTKDVMRGRTYSSLREVTAEARREEIARMLGGKSESALELAASLLNET